jgi:RecA/RadA recombinase
VKRPPDSLPIGLLAPADGRAGACLPTGWPALDALLGRGWQAGELSELCGHGRTTLAQAAVRTAQRAGQPTCWIDGPGTFCPATAGVDLSQLVLVTPGGTGWSAAVVRAAAGLRRRGARRERRALLAADLLLRSRAFGLIVLDLGEDRAPLSAWFRLARQARAAQTALLLLAGESPRAGSAAALTLRVAQRHAPVPRWALPPRPALELTVLRRRGGAGGGVLLLDLDAATTDAAARVAR